MREQGPILIADHRGLYPNNLDAAIAEQDRYFGRTPMKLNERGHSAEPNKSVPAKEPSHALREIAGRLKKLTFLEMQEFATRLKQKMPVEANEVFTHDQVIYALLDAAGELEKA